MNDDDRLGPREREIMAVIYRLGRATAEQVRESLADRVTNAGVRGMLRLLEDKGLLRHKQEGRTYVYSATADREKVKRSALRQLLATFFDNSAESALAAMLGMFQGELTDEDLARMEKRIEEQRKGGRQ